MIKKLSLLFICLTLSKPCYPTCYIENLKKIGPGASLIAGWALTSYAVAIIISNLANCDEYYNAKHLLEQMDIRIKDKYVNIQNENIKEYIHTISLELPKDYTQDEHKLIQAQWEKIIALYKYDNINQKLLPFVMFGAYVFVSIGQHSLYDYLHGIPTE